MNFSKKAVQKKRRFFSKKSPKIKRKLSIISFEALLFFVAVFLVITVGCGLGALNGIIQNAPDIHKINIQPEGFSSTIYDSEKRELQKLSQYDSNRIYVTIDKIPKNLQNAFIAIEDSRFYDHHGIDMKGIFRAAILGIKNHNFSQGASTITQQLLKNNVFSIEEETTFYEKVERKLQEQYLALQIEKKYSKQQILEYYLNSINLGQSTLGVQAASLQYFNKDVSELNLSECAVLASITQNPTKYDPLVNPSNNLKRRNTVLSYMLEENKITQADYDKAMSDDTYSRIKEVSTKHSNSNSYSYYVDALIEQVINDLQEKKGYSQTQAYNALYRGGLSIYSTQDQEIQSICDSVFTDDSYFPVETKYQLTYQLSIQNAEKQTINYSESDVLEFLKQKNSNATLDFNSKKDAEQAANDFRASVTDKNTIILGENIGIIPQPQASFVLMDQTNGEVKALVGGRGKKSGNLTLNRATNTTRQPGSTFKILSTFVPALDISGMTLATTFDDAPYCYDGTNRQVKNYYTTGYRGFSSIRDAIRDSMNVVTAKAFSTVTPQVGYDYLLNLGFTTLESGNTYSDGKTYSDIQQSLCLGGITRGVKNIELTAAYAAIANQGTYNQPILYTKIVDQKGKTILENNSSKKQVMKESTSWLLINAMKDVVTSGTGTAASLDSKMPAAGKTGTTSNNYDHWFAGMTPYYTASIWCGYDDNTDFETNHLDLNIWKVIMDKIISTKQLPIKDFPDCKDIVSCNVCSKSGKLPIDGICNQDPRGSCIKTEYFAKGTEPTESCSMHTKIKICKLTNLPATEYCPIEDIIEKVFFIRPEGSRGKTADTPYELPANYKNNSCNIHTADWLANQSPQQPQAQQTSP